MCMYMLCVCVCVRACVHVCMYVCTCVCVCVGSWLAIEVFIGNLLATGKGVGHGQ